MRDRHWAKTWRKGKKSRKQKGNGKKQKRKAGWMASAMFNRCWKGH